ncbi:MAG: copper amine oxidase N-terminal domain-containing protein [Clostridiales bacterium]|nr:copper amine oxidase N-terminal domain-containing protein [Clostridiales bacterium]
MNPQKAVKKPILCLCLALLLLLSLAACDKQAEEQDSTPPTVVPTEEATPTPEPTPPIPFTDVPEDSYYYDAVVWAYGNGIASDSDTFEPLSTCTRGQAITFIWRAMGSPEPQITENPISDISPSNWYYKPALWAYESGISTSSSFKPNNSCTNGEALTFLWRAEGEPMAAVNSSTVALAASGAYYERPAAWADNNGLFAQLGAAFDPSAPCSRAYLMSYLYWAEEQWTSAEETRALQGEYEQIVNSAQPYEVFGSGLFYADYVDMDNDGKVDLLTVGVDWETFAAIATVYSNIDGHAGKLCEQDFGLAGAFDWLSIYQADGQLYLGIIMEHRYVGDEYAFFKVENGSFVCNDNVREEFDSNLSITHYIGLNEKEISEDEYRATIKKYTKQKELFSIGPSWYEFGECGILSAPGVEVNGVPVKLSANPYYSIFEDDVMVPLRDVLEAMGVAVYANSDASVILASTKSDTLVITYKDFSDWDFEGINSIYYGRDKTYKYSMNGGEFQRIAIEFTNGKAFLPLQTIVSLFDATAEWDGKAGAMQITSNIPDSNRMTQDELKQLANFDMKQAQKIAVDKGYETPYKTEAGDGTKCGLTFKNGKAVWNLFVVKTPSYGGGLHYVNARLSLIEVASDGTVTVDSKEYIEPGGQV